MGYNKEIKKFILWSLLILLVVGFYVFFAIKFAVPGIVGGGKMATESSAVSVLRTIYWAENSLIKNKAKDRDSDGVFEYGLFSDLTSKTINLNSMIKTVSPILLEPEFRNFISAKNIGVVQAKGYYFIIYLQSKSGDSVSDSASNDGTSRISNDSVSSKKQDILVDSNSAERFWIAYAWTVNPKVSGRRSFFINQNEDIYELDLKHSKVRYEGLSNIPPFFSALPVSSFSSRPEKGKGGKDGSIWLPWKNKGYKRSLLPSFIKKSLLDN